MAWSIDSWQTKPAKQQVEYADAAALSQTLSQLQALPPLVSTEEVQGLRASIAKAQAGEAFLLQGGDCAERFVDCAAQPIEDKLRVLLQMSLILTWGARLPVVRLGRIAGQYAKPRSKPTEVIDGVEMHSYRGDHVNKIDATPEARMPNPRRMLDSYFRSAATLNYARSLAHGGFSDLRRLHNWDLAHLRAPQKRAKYAALCERIDDALAFMEITGASQAAALAHIDFFTSHESLSLDYESTQTVQHGDEWYNLGAHFLWVGERTRQVDGAHVEYLRGIQNPIGIKVGPTAKADDILGLLDILNPENQPGRITLITRVGHKDPATILGPIVEKINTQGRWVLWSSDPMHGNTKTTADGIKTRDFSEVMRELDQTLVALEQCGSHLGGVHLELTGQDVTECVGGPQDLVEADLTRNYQSYCDPRLNFEQSLEVAFHIAERLTARRPEQR